MSHYKHILAAVDFSTECEKVLASASNMVKDGVDLHVIHVVQPIANTYSTGLAGGFVALQENDFDQTAVRVAQEQLAEMGTKWDIPSSSQHVVLGHPKEEIHRIAKELHTDLIVIGSHGRQGVKLLLGSTANAVLHGATCDVLAVRI